MTRPDLFNANIASTINSALGPLVLSATLTRHTHGTRNPAAVTAGLTVGATTTAYPCKGFIDEWSKTNEPKTLVEENDRKIVLLGGSLPDAIDPQTGDTITIEGRDYIVTGPVMRDPAGATFTCRGRP